MWKGAVQLGLLRATCELEEPKQRLHREGGGGLQRRKTGRGCGRDAATKRRSGGGEDDVWSSSKSTGESSGTGSGGSKENMKEIIHNVTDEL